jgi:hypothetical protein
MLGRRARGGEVLNKALEQRQTRSNTVGPVLGHSAVHPNLLRAANANGKRGKMYGMLGLMIVRWEISANRMVAQARRVIQ